jgi:hypothetical protein
MYVKYLCIWATGGFLRRTQFRRDNYWVQNNLNEWFMNKKIENMLPSLYFRDFVQFIRQGFVIDLILGGAVTWIPFLVILWFVVTKINASWEQSLIGLPWARSRLNRIICYVIRKERNHVGLRIGSSAMKQSQRDGIKIMVFCRAL